MKFFVRHLIPALLATACTLASGQPTQLTVDVPECRMPPGKVLPNKYYKLASANKDFKWVPKATASDHIVDGNGWERIDGSNMHNWFVFYRVDLNGDGYCDWYLNASAPMSSGGDRDTINTLYLGGPNGWARVGATVPGDKPDQLGAGNSNDEQDHYLFGEEIAVIHDAASKVNYIITAFYERNEERDSRPGYRIFDWDADKKTLRLLDKWMPGSKAAEVYAFFKAHGARRPAYRSAAASDTIQSFDPDVEAFELTRACDPKSARRSFPESNGIVSPYLLARCKR